MDFMTSRSMCVPSGAAAKCQSGANDYSTYRSPTEKQTTLPTVWGFF